MMNMIDENDRLTRYESIKTWEQQKNILQARKKVSMKATKNYGDRVSVVLSSLVFQPFSFPTAPPQTIPLPPAEMNKKFPDT